MASLKVVVNCQKGVVITQGWEYAGCEMLLTGGCCDCSLHRLNGGEVNRVYSQRSSIRWAAARA